MRSSASSLLAGGETGSTYSAQVALCSALRGVPGTDDSHFCDYTASGGLQTCDDSDQDSLHEAE